jgi:hypothetical protein
MQEINGSDIMVYANNKSGGVNHLRPSSAIRH